MWIRAIVTLLLRGWRPVGRAFVATLLGAALAGQARGSVTVLVGEPFDAMGKALPVGHTTIYLDRVCADGPLKVRMCQPGEPQGVAIARYYHLGQYDWMATPILQFLYGADSVQDVLPYATPELVGARRRNYWRRYLADIFPDGTEIVNKNEEWQEQIGMAYARGMWGYRMATSAAQDERVVAALNGWPNHRAYKPYTANCANFAAEVLALYVPGLVKRDRTADLGFLLPKQVARSMERYGRRHPEAELEVVELPQLPGSLPRSWKVRGGAETFVKEKRYILPLLVVQPEIAASLSVMYLAHGRWTLGRGAVVESPEWFAQQGGVGEGSVSAAAAE